MRAFNSLSKILIINDVCFRRSTGREDPSASISLSRPQVRCESQLVAEYASYTINCAKSQWEEMRQTLPPEDASDSEILFHVIYIYFYILNLQHVIYPVIVIDMYEMK